MKPKRRRPPVVLPTASYSYPLCCAVPTVLSVFGWRCGVCATYLPFRNDAGLTWEQHQGQALQGHPEETP